MWRQTRGRPPGEIGASKAARANTLSRGNGSAVHLVNGPREPNGWVSRRNPAVISRVSSLWGVGGTMPPLIDHAADTHVIKAAGR